MMKTMTWISLGLTLLGALIDAGSSGKSDAETAAEVVLLAKVFGGPAAPASPDGADTTQPAARRQ